jgi:predicted Ser/Thr protein kinase
MCPACVAGFAEVPGPAEGALKPGSTFGRYEILEAVGRGGMGVVYRARQTGLDREVALKVVSPRLAADPGFVARFQREARTLARLSHANIVAVHDFGVEAGTPFLVMEFVEGVSLRRLLAERRLPPEEALGIVPQLCDALEYAHAEGVVHRDIKPENILIDRRGRVKIADFGLAVMLGVEPARLTRTDAVLGTPHYMAPEQIENPRGVDHRADIYSMGVVFYEMLTGELPLGHFSMPSSKARVSRRLDEIVLRALAKEPERRYQRASHLKQEVETAPRTPEEGRRLVRGWEWRTKSAILGWPLVHICSGTDEQGRPLWARGVIAIGNRALGLVALGGLAIGLLAFGGGAVGLVALGGGAVGAMALGGGAVGVVAVGGGAAGYYAAGGGAAGAYVVSGHRTDWEAWDFFDDWPGLGDWLHRNTPDPRPWKSPAWPAEVTPGPARDVLDRFWSERARPAHRQDVFDPETVYAAAEKALAADSRLDDWRPELKKALEAYLRLLGENVPAKAGAFARDRLESCFAGPAEVHRLPTQGNTDTGNVFLVERGKGPAPPRSALIVCRSADYERIDGAVVVCLGDLAVRGRINDSFVWVRGNLLLPTGEPKHSVVFCGGRLIADEGKESSILALAGADLEDGSSQNVYVNTPEVRSGWSQDDRRVELKGLPAPLPPIPDPFAEGMKAYQAGDFDGAMRRFCRVPRSDAKAFATAMRYVGYNILVRERNRAEEGIPYLDLAYGAAPDDPKVLEDLRRAYEKAGKTFERKKP